MRSVLGYTAVLVGVYLALAYATNGGKLVAAGSGAYNSAVRTLQGR